MDHSTQQHHHHSRHRNTAYYAAIFIALFGVIEAVCGVWSGSLTLLSDAGHMGADALALFITAIVAWFGRRPATSRHTYGFGRIEVIASWLSSILLLITITGILIEAISRWHQPHVIASKTVIFVAILGLIVNILTAWILNLGEKNINTRAALLHVFGDLLGSIAALASGIIINFTHWNQIDPLLSTFICGLILISVINLLRESVLILMEGAPNHIDSTKVELMIKNISGVHTVHDLHIWTLTSGKTLLTAHVVITDHTTWPQITDNVRTIIQKDFGITHSTIQIETINQTVPCIDCRNS